MRLPVRPFLLLALAGFALVACDDSPTDPGSDRFDVGGVFTDDEAEATRDGNSTRLLLHTVEFTDGESSTLTAPSLTVLDKFALLFENLPGATYLVESHTDERGTRAFNQTLSEERARTVRNYLVDEVGGPGVAFTTAGHGEDRPLDPRSNAQAWSLNDRIEITVTEPSGRVFEVSLSADLLEIQQDCDSYTSSPSAAAGDFWVSVQLRRVVGNERRVIASSGPTFRQGHDGDVVVVNLQATGLYDATTDARLEAIVSLYEVDPDARQFDRADTSTFSWDPATGCWSYAGDTNCLGRTGSIVSSVLRVRNVPGDPCSVDLGWSFRASPLD